MSSFSSSAVENLMHFMTANRAQIAASEFCVCMDCHERFPPDRIGHYLKDGTAFCPECGNDAVIGSASNLPLTDPAFLAATHARWFTPLTRRIPPKA